MPLKVKVKPYNNSFTKEFIDSECGSADPFLIKVNGFYYLTFTAPSGLMLYKSFDLLHFEKVNGTGKISETADFPAHGYAPEINYINGKFYLVCSPSGNGHYLFTSDNIEGPFKLVSENFHEMIDGSIFVDSDEKVYFTRASETGITIKEVDRNLKKEGDFAYFLNELTYKQAKVGRWNEGPHLFKRYGTYYLTFTGTHFLSNAYRVEYCSGKSLKEEDLHYKDIILLETSKDFYGLGHSMNILGPDLDSYYICYHNMTPSGVRNFNISRLLFNNYGEMWVNGPKLNNNLVINRPYYEDFGTSKDYISSKTTKNNKEFSIEYNFKGKEAKLFLEKVSENYKYFKLSEKKLSLFDHKDGKDTVIYERLLNYKYRLDVLHNLRIQYSKGKMAIYLDNVELEYNLKINLNKGYFGYFNNELEKAYIACSNYAFGSSDLEVANYKKAVPCAKKHVNKFIVEEDGIYDLVIENAAKSAYFTFIDEDGTIKKEVITLKNKNKLTTIKSFNLKKGIFELVTLKTKNVKSISLLKRDFNGKDLKLNIKDLSSLNEFDVLHRYNLANIGIHFENDRNAILTKDEYFNYEVSTDVKLFGKAIEDIDFVGLIASIKHYGKDNQFEGPYSMIGIQFVLNSEHVFINLAKYYRTITLAKFKNKYEGIVNLKIKKENDLFKFFINNELIYSYDALGHIREGKIGIYNNHASGAFNNLEIKGEKL